MAHYLKNLSGYPMDVQTLTGPAILPAYGELTVDLSAYDAEVMGFSPYVEISEGKPDHTTETDDIETLRAEYKDLSGKDADGRWKADRIQSEIDKKLAE